MAVVKYKSYWHTVNAVTSWLERLWMTVQQCIFGEADSSALGLFEGMLSSISTVQTSLNQTADFENWISLVSLSTNLPYTSVHEFFSLYLQYHSHSGHEATFSSQLRKSMKHTHTHWITQPNHAISRALLSRVWIKHNASVSQIILTGEVWTANIFVWCCPPAWINGI